MGSFGSVYWIGHEMLRMKEFLQRSDLGFVFMLLIGNCLSQFTYYILFYFFGYPYFVGEDALEK